MKNIFVAIMIFAVSTSAFALDCSGYKEGSFTIIKLEDTKRAIPEVYGKYDAVEMNAILVGEILILVMSNSNNKKEYTRTDISNFSRNKDFQIVTSLVADGITYQLACK